MAGQVVSMRPVRRRSAIAQRGGTVVAVRHLSLPLRSGAGCAPVCDYHVRQTEPGSGRHDRARRHQPARPQQRKRRAGSARGARARRTAGSEVVL